MPARHCCAQVQEAGVNQVSDPAVKYRPRPTQPQQLRENHTETEGGMLQGSCASWKTLKTRNSC